MSFDPLSFALGMFAGAFLTVIVALLIAAGEDDRRRR